MTFFDSQTTKFPYPEDTAEHYIKTKQNRGLVFDEHYQYIDRSKSFLLKQSLLRHVLFVLVYPITRIRLGLKINNKKVFKQYKDLLSQGAITISNHVHFWDYLAVMLTLRPAKPYILSWAPNLNDSDGKLVRLVGGIPIPENNIKATFKQLKEVGQMLDEGGWLHIYPEGSMWEYYRPIRPFKKGFEYLANKHHKPIIPMAFSYRKPNWIRRVIFRQIAVLNLNIGEPLTINSSIDKNLQKGDLIKRAHEQVVALAGLTKEENIYEPIYHHSKRIDYYAHKSDSNSNKKQID